MKKLLNSKVSISLIIVFKIFVMLLLYLILIPALLFFGLNAQIHKLRNLMSQRISKKLI